MKEHYIDFVLDEYVADGNFDAGFGDEWIDEEQLHDLYPSVCNFAFADYGIDAGSKYTEHVKAIFDAMMGSAIVRQGDEYTGYWYKLRPPHKAKLLADRRAKNPVADRVDQLGEEALRRALNRIVAEDGLRSMEDKWAEFNQGGLQSEVATDDWEPDAQKENAVQLNSDYFHSEAQKVRFISETDDQLAAVDAADLSNSERAQARGYLRAAKALAEVPDPPADLIWKIINRAASIAGIAGFFLTLLALIAAAG